MSNRLRFRSGHVILVKVPADKDSSICAGDIVALTDEVNPVCVPVTEVPDDQVSRLFLGVAHQPSVEGESFDISVDISSSSVYEFDVGSAAGSFRFGYLLSPCPGENQQLDHCVTTDGTGAIARIMGPGSDQVHPTMRVSFASAFFTGSANKYARIG